MHLLWKRHLPTSHSSFSTTHYLSRTCVFTLTHTLWRTHSLTHFYLSFASKLAVSMSGDIACCRHRHRRRHRRHRRHRRRRTNMMKCWPRGAPSPALPLSCPGCRACVSFIRRRNFALTDSDPMKLLAHLTHWSMRGNLGLRTSWVRTRMGL